MSINALAKNPLAAAVVSSIITITAIKTDISWIKDTLKTHEARIYQLENNKWSNKNERLSTQKLGANNDASKYDWLGNFGGKLDVTLNSLSNDGGGFIPNVQPLF